MAILERRTRIATRGQHPAAVTAALERLGDVRPLTDDGGADADLVVVDLDGAGVPAFCAAIRARDTDGWLPVLAVGSRESGLQAALAAGADDHATRDAPDDVVARATTLLRLKVKHDEVAARATQFTDWTRTLVERVTEQVEQLQRMERLRRFLSPEVAEAVAGDERLLESHRREIAVVFCDLRGFTAFSEVAEPEEVMGVLREYHAALGELVFRFGATLERFAGDAILAFFNDPVPCPDPAGQALRMATAMRESVRGLIPGWRKRGHDLDFGVGIAVGYATLGRIGFDRRFDYGAVGSVVNLAARLCAEALGGQILLSERAYGMVADLVEAEALAPLQLKGFHRPMSAYNVVALRESDRSEALAQSRNALGTPPA
jgi:class 3 adenylate cyclase